MSERQVDQARLLDSFSAQLRRNPRAQAPDGLDPELADVARMVARSTPLTAADGATVARVWQRLEAANAALDARRRWAPASGRAVGNGRLPASAEPALNARPHGPRRDEHIAAFPDGRRWRNIRQLVAELVLLIVGAGLLLLLFRGGLGEQVGNPGDAPATPTLDTRLSQRVVAGWRVEGDQLDGSTLAGMGVAGNGTLYIADVANSRILHVRADGTLITAFGRPGSGPGELSLSTSIRLSNIGVDSDGNVYVPDHGNSRVQIFTSDGAYLTSWDGSDTIAGGIGVPTSVAIDRQGNAFVAGYLPASNGWNILKLDPDGRVILTIHDQHGAEIWDGDVSSITLDAADNLYVTDAATNRVLTFDNDGVLLFGWGRTGSDPGAFNAPQAIAVSADGNAYVADGFNFRVQRFDTNGHYLGQWGNQVGSEIAFDRPLSVAVDQQGAIYVVDRGNSLQKFHLESP